MKLREDRYRLAIEPTSEIEVAYIEEVLKLKHSGDTASCKRINAMGLNSIAYIEITKDESKEHAMPYIPATVAEHFLHSSRPTTRLNTFCLNNLTDLANKLEKFSMNMFKQIVANIEVENDYIGHQIDEQEVAQAKQELFNQIDDGNYVAAALILVMLENHTKETKQNENC